MFVYLMTFFAVLLLMAGVIAIVLRRRGRYVRPSGEEEETIAGLDKAFGKNMKWGSPGATESELRDHTQTIGCGADVDTDS
jgi:hypothetical protein